MPLIFATRLHYKLLIFAAEIQPFNVSLKMQKRIVNINLIFIWLTGLMFFSHGVTPHHHHFDSLFEHSDSSGHSDDNPSHCHAFNDLVADNTGISISNFSIYNNITGLFPENDSYFRNTENSFGIINWSKQDNRLIKSVFPESSPTRGSPAFI